MMTRPSPRKSDALHRRRSVLLVEDTSSLLMIYRSIVTKAGHTVHTATTAAEAMTAFAQHAPQVVLLDLELPDRDGQSVLEDILAAAPGTIVIVLTANGSINRAVAAMRSGAHDFLVKPIDETRLIAAVENATGSPPAARGTGKALMQAGLQAGPAAQMFIGSSDVMARLQDKIQSVATSMATVFITGESGTGKELAALAVHGNSPRAEGPFIALNCGAIPQDLLESEVFGHVKGSFTGAIADKPGAAAAADGGTLFLDEVCEMALPLQTKLLRFLQTSTVQPVGATRPRKVNVRIVCATNLDPLDAVRRGQFREDLYYRLFVMPIHMPPLRQRGEDVIEIAEAALDRFAAEEDRRFTGLDEPVKALFRRYNWPGNIRQLLNVLRNVVVLNRGGLVTLDMLPDGLTEVPEASIIAATVDQHPLGDLIGKTLAEIERAVIEATLARHDGSVSRAARTLEIAPSTLYRKIESWGKTTR
ncbi:MAG: sigma-54-dependent transcriptional regulator [Paracoccaceae bacterium]